MMNRSAIQDGSEDRICPQAAPRWTVFEGQFLPANLTGQPSNLTQADLVKLNSSITVSSLPPVDPRTNEDCLFLDVLTPKSVYDSKDNDTGKGAPVLIWIYGGGYVAGVKSTYNPPGLIYRSENNGREPIVFVSMNYRLGALGWLAGPTFQQSGTANNGLLDQRAAFEWVQENIHLFGGDKDRVTIIGESAGGGSVMHHLTAYGGRDDPPFQQAIAQSPGFLPLVSNAQNDNILGGFLQLLNVSTIDEARNLPSDQIITANSLQVAASNYGGFTYGPSVDGSYVPQLPGQLMLQGNFNKGIRVMTGKNSEEGIYFANPFISSEDGVRTYLEQFLPTANTDALNYLLTSLYPPAPVNDKSLSYDDQYQRLYTLLGEAILQCNTFFMDTAYAALNQSFGYYFEIPPGIHGEDLVYTFYNNQGLDIADQLLNTTVAIALQDYITTFAQNGAPSSPDVQGIPNFQLYGTDSKVEDFQLGTVLDIVDPQKNARCQWWQKALYV